MTREEAVALLERYSNYDGMGIQNLAGCKEAMRVAVDALKEAYPELTESEDERIRKKIIEHLEMIKEGSVICVIDTSKEIAWLEKQKENPKSADSIPSDCVSDAKYEDRWHKVEDSLPNNGRMVLANDCLGNTLLARYDGEGNWEVSVYDNEDYYCRNTITKWCEIPSEKQKEQKPEITLVGDGSPLRIIDKSELKMTLKEAIENLKLFRYRAIHSIKLEDSIDVVVEYLEKEQKPVESISQLTVQGKGVYKICPRCKERMVRDNSMVYTSMPPQYIYECPKCGERECDTVMYDNPEMEERKPTEWSERKTRERKMSYRGFTATDCIRLKHGVCRLDLKPCKKDCPLRKTKEEVEQHKKKTRI